MGPQRSTAEGRDPSHATDDGHASNRSVEEYPLPPGPDGYPIVGNTFELVRDAFAFLETLAEYGDVVRYEITRRPFTALFHPDHVERVLVEEPDRFERHLFSDLGFDFAPEGVLFTDGAQWRTQREVMQPAFTVERIQSYADTMTDYAERTIDSWEDSQEVALNPAFSGLTLRILAKSLFDIDVEPGEDDADEAITRAARAINERGDSRRLSTFLPSWLPVPSNRRYERALREYRDRVDELIDERRANSQTGETGVERESTIEPGIDGERRSERESQCRDDLLSILLESSSEGEENEATLSEAEVRDNLLTFLFAGHETTSLGLSYTSLLLARHDDVADKLHAELEDVLDGESPRFEHVRALEYTEWVLKEALRLYPPAYMQFRKATEDAVIGGYRIPEGTILSIPQYQIHRDERFYEEPEAFRPERWAGDRDRPEYAYFPFGGGPRHCLGMRFAMLEMTLVVATLVQRFELTLSSDPEPELAAGATLTPAEDVRVRVYRR